MIGRRAVVPMAKNSESNAVTEVVSEINNANPVANEDLSYAVRREAALERARDFLQLRKGVPTASVYPKKVHRRRRSKVSSALTILTQFALLVAALLYLGQLFLKWTAGSQWDANPSFASLDYEDRISEIQKSLKITAKMLQVQVEVIEKKIGSEIDIATRELQKQVEEKGELIEDQLKKLESRTNDLVRSLADLENHDLITREEIEKFWDEMKSNTDQDDLGKAVYLDEIMGVVVTEIEKHAADGIGKVDYALASGGGRVVRHSEPYVYGIASSWLAVANGKTRVHSNAQKMLEPSFGEPGQCFAMRGSSGFVEIRLREGIIPEAITLEHVSKTVAYDMSTAPKNFHVAGWYEGPEDDPSDKIVNFAADFSYDIEKSSTQTFTIPSVDPGVVNTVRLNFTSNHGSSALTCIYRVRVHGYAHAVDER